MKLSNKTYDVLKWIAQYFLPALGTLYFAVANIWGLPYAEQVVGTITAIDAFLGVILGISTSKYKGDGTLVVDCSDESTIKSILKLGITPEELVNKEQVTFKVHRDAE